MSFSIFSFAVALLIGTIIFAHAIKGSKQGFQKSLITLGICIGSLILAIFLARLISDPVAKLAVGLIERSGAIDGIYDKIRHLNLLLFAVIDALITPILFVILYFLCRLIISIVVVPITRAFMKDLSYDTGCNDENTPWHKRNTKALGAAVGVVCGLLSSIALISPIYGTVRTAGEVVGLIHGEEAVLPIDLGEKVGGELDTVIRYGKTVPGTTLDIMGGEALFHSLAYSKCEYSGTYVDGKGREYEENIEFELYIAKEIDNVELILKDAAPLMNISNTGGFATKENIDVVRNIMDDVHHSEILQLVAADALSGAAKNWSDGITYMQIKKPDLGSAGNYLLDVILDVFEKTDNKHVIADMTTMLNVIEIMLDTGMLDGNYDYTQLLFDMDEQNTLDRLYEEFSKNIRTAHIPNEVMNMTTNIAAEALTNLLDDKQYAKMTESLASQWNSISSISDRATQVNVIANTTKEVASDYNVDIPPSVADATAEVIVSTFSGYEEISSKQVDDFIKMYKDLGFLTQGGNEQ